MPSPLWRTVRKHAARNGWEAVGSRTGADGTAITFRRGSEQLEVHFGPVLPKLGIPFLTARHRPSPDAAPRALSRARDVLRVLESPRLAIRSTRASELAAGDRIRRLGREVVVEKIRHEPLSSAVSVFTCDGRLVLRWDEVVELLEQKP